MPQPFGATSTGLHAKEKPGPLRSLGTGTRKMPIKLVGYRQPRTVVLIMNRLSPCSIPIAYPTHVESLANLDARSTAH